jgi:hypothetical protein
MEEPNPIDVDILNLCIQRIIFSSTFLGINSREKNKLDEPLNTLMLHYHIYCRTIGLLEPNTLSSHKNYQQFVDKLKASMLSSSCKALLPK